MYLMPDLEDHLTYFTPERLNTLRREGDAPIDNAYPWNFRRAPGSLSAREMIQGGGDMKHVTDPNDPDVKRHPDRVYSVRFDKEECAALAKLKNVTRVVYTDKKSSVLPPELLTHANVRAIVFDGATKIKKLPKTLAQMPNLEAVEILLMGAITDVSALAFIPKLRALRLYATTKLQDFQFLASLSEVEELHLCSLKLSALPHQLAMMPKLRRLTLSGIIDEGVDLSVLAQLPELEALTVDWLRLDAIPAEIGQLSGLRALYLEHCDATELSVIGQLSELAHLQLHDPKVEALPASWGQLPRLASLDLSNAKTLRDISALSSVPLQRLKLDRYEGESLPVGLDKLSTLRELSLDQSYALRDLSALSALTGLEVLSMSYLKLEQPPEALSALSALRVLHVSEARWDTASLWAHPSLEFVFLGSSEAAAKAAPPEDGGFRRVSHGVLFPR